MGVTKSGTVKYSLQPKEGAAGPMLYPAGIYVIGSQTKYIRTELSAPVVLFEDQYYALNYLGEVDSSLNPKEDYAAQGNKATWVLCPRYQIAIYEAIFAAFAKLGAAIFNGDFMLSQYGVDAKGNPVETANGYKDFTPGMENFTPNILLNFLTGYAHFAAGNVKFCEDGSGHICGNFIHWNNNGILYRRHEMIKEYVPNEEIRDNNGYIGPSLGSFYSNRDISFGSVREFYLEDPVDAEGFTLELEQNTATRAGGYYNIYPRNKGELKYYDTNKKEYISVATASPLENHTGHVISRGYYWEILNPAEFSIEKEA